MTADGNLAGGTPALLRQRPLWRRRRTTETGPCREDVKTATVDFLYVGGGPNDMDRKEKVGHYARMTIRARASYWGQRLKSKEALVPPKPNELESAYSTSALRD